MKLVKTFNNVKNGISQHFLNITRDNVINVNDNNILNIKYTAIILGSLWRENYAVLSCSNQQKLIFFIIFWHKPDFCRSPDNLCGKNYFCWQKLFLPSRFFLLKKTFFSPTSKNLPTSIHHHNRYCDSAKTTLMCQSMTSSETSALVWQVSKNVDKRLHCQGGEFSLTNWMWHSIASAASQPEYWSTACGEIPTSGPLGMVLNGVRENPDVIPSKVPPADGDLEHHLTQLLGPTQVQIPNGISISSAIFARLMVSRFPNRLPVSNQLTGCRLTSLISLRTRTV